VSARYRRFHTDRPRQFSANKPDFVTANKLQFEAAVLKRTVAFGAPVKHFFGQWKSIKKITAHFTLGTASDGILR